VRYNDGDYVWDAATHTLTLNWLYDFTPIDITDGQIINEVHLPAPANNSDALCGSIVHLQTTQSFELGVGGKIIAAGGE
jgi:hypothetical protein